MRLNERKRSQRRISGKIQLNEGSRYALYHSVPSAGCAVEMTSGLVR